MSVSGTPLFVSAKIDDVNDDMRNELKKAFALASVQKTGLEPVDWTYNTCPAIWRSGKEYYNFDFDDVFGADA